MAETNRRRAALLVVAGLACLAVAPALAQDTHTGGHSGGGGHTPGGGHSPTGNDEGEVAGHEPGGHEPGGHEPGGHEPGADEGHEDGKRGPRYRGGTKSGHLLGRGYGRSLEDRVLKGG